jgi:hypothetical protein
LSRKKPTRVVLPIEEEEEEEEDGKIKDGREVIGRRGRIRKKLLDVLRKGQDSYI